MTVVAADGAVAGTVVDAWVDRSETFVRFLEVDTGTGGRRVLVPMMLTRIDPARNTVKVNSVTAAQLAEIEQVVAGVSGERYPASFAKDAGR